MTTNRTKEAIKRHLREQLAKAANAYALELHRQWGMERTGDDYWIGGEQEPCGAPYQLHSYYFLSLDEMQYIIDNDVTQQEYDDYHEYVQRVVSVSDRLHVPPFREWREHPEHRYKAEELGRLQMLQDEVNREIDRIKTTTDLKD